MSTQYSVVSDFTECLDAGIEQIINLSKSQLVGGLQPSLSLSHPWSDFVQVKWKKSIDILKLG